MWSNMTSYWNVVWTFLKYILNNSWCLITFYFFPTLFSRVMRKKAKSALKVNYHWLIVFCHFSRWLDRTSHFPKPNLLWGFGVWLFPKVSQKFQINPVGLIPNDQVTKSGRNRSPLECPWAGIGIFISWMWSSSSWIWGIYTETGNFLESQIHFTYFAYLTSYWYFSYSAYLKSRSVAPNWKSRWDFMDIPL